MVTAHKVQRTPSQPPPPTGVINFHSIILLLLLLYARTHNNNIILYDAHRLQLPRCATVQAHDYNDR